MSEVFQVFFQLFSGRYRIALLYLVLPPSMKKVSKKNTFTHLQIAILQDFSAVGNSVERTVDQRNKGLLAEDSWFKSLSLPLHFVIFFLFFLFFFIFYCKTDKKHYSPVRNGQLVFSLFLAIDLGGKSQLLPGSNFENAAWNFRVKLNLSR